MGLFRKGTNTKRAGLAGRAGAGFTERLARTSATHPWRTIGVWMALIVVAVVSMGSLLSQRSHLEHGVPRQQTRQPHRSEARAGPAHRSAEA